MIFHVVTLNAYFLSFRKFQELIFRNVIYVIFVILRKLLIIRRNEPACSSNQNCTVRVCEVFLRVLGFFSIFCAQFPSKKVKSKNPPCLVSFGSFLAVYWFYWQVHHFGSKIWLSQKTVLCWSYDLHMAKMAS